MHLTIILDPKSSGLISGKPYAVQSRSIRGFHGRLLGLFLHVKTKVLLL